MTDFRKALITTTILALGLSACTSPGGQVTSANAKTTTARTGMAVDASLARFGQRNAVRAGGAQLSDGVFVAATPERANAGVNLPARFEAAGAVVIESSEKLSLGQIAGRLGEITRIPHLVALGPTAVKTSGSVEGTGGDTDLRIETHLRGPLSSVLNEIAAAFEVEWSFVGGRVVFQDYVTRQYQISALPTSNTGSTAIGSNGLTSTSTIASDLWAEIGEALDGMAGEGANVSIGSGSGLVTVTAKVGDHNRIKQYVDDLNGNIGQQITFDVNVLNVSLDRATSLGVDLNAAFGGASVTDQNAASFNGGVLNIGVVEGDFSINAVVNALSRQGEVTVATRAAATTSNNRMAPLELIEKTTYLAEISSETDDLGNVSYTRTPGEVTTGFQLQLFPRVLNNREMMVQYAVQISELNQLKTFGEGNDAIQLPEISTTSFEQQAVLENGQTLILAGFERDRASTNDTSMSNVGGLPVGGVASAETTRVATVMMITPRLINRRGAVGAGN